MGFSITCVVEMLTTAGPSFLEMAEKALERVMGSGTASSVAPVAVWSCSGLRAAGDQRADDDSDGESEDDEEGGENFAAAHPAE